MNIHNILFETTTRHWFDNARPRANNFTTVPSFHFFSFGCWNYTFWFVCNWLRGFVCLSYTKQPLSGTNCRHYFVGNEENKIWS